MQQTINPSQRRRDRKKRGAHADILTLDDLPQTKAKYSLLIDQFLATRQSARQRTDLKLEQRSDDFST